MTRFTVPASSTHVEFGSGAIDAVGAWVATHNAQCAFLIASRRRTDLAERVRAQLGGRHCAISHRVVMHVPHDVAEDVARHAAECGADLIVAIGGGSAIGMAKAVTLLGGPPFVAVPTTYSGSEMTSIWGFTRDGVKTTGRDDRVRARAVFYDPDVLASLPERQAVPSALNALAHALEALYAPDPSPLATLAAAESAGLLLHALSSAGEGSGSHRRTDLLKGAWLAGYALGATQMGLHHKLCHVLGGTFGLPHAETHAILLPYTIGYNIPAAAQQLAPLAASLGVSVRALPTALFKVTDHLLTACRAPRTLHAIGFNDTDIPRAAELVSTVPYPNPASVHADRIAQLLHRAMAGTGPAE